MKPKMILFDLGNTLVTFKHDRLKQSDAPGIYEFYFAKHNGVSRNMLLDRGELELEQAHEAYSRQHGAISFEKTRQIWCSIFDEPNMAALECVLKTRERGLKVGICSNTNRYHWEHVLRRCPAYGEPSILKFLSYEMNSVKTDGGFFQRIAKQTGVAIEEHLLIDDLAENIRAAEDNGLQAMLVNGPVEFGELEGKLG